MAFEHVPLSESELGPAVWKVVRPEAPAPLQGMVARGLAPLPPRDLVVALYQFWVTNLPELAAQSAKTVEGLPPPIVTGALGDASLPAGVLDFLARKLPRNVQALESIVRHPAVADETLVGLSRICPEGICDLLAENQTRWLNCPAIVESLYQNPNCRMSVAQRMLELAVREGLELGLPNMEEIKQAIASQARNKEAEAEPEADAESEAADDQQFRDVAQRVLAGQEQVLNLVTNAAADEELELDLPDDPEEELPDIDEKIAAAEAAAAEAEAENAAEEAADPITVISKLAPMKKIRLALMGNAFERAVLIRDSNKSVCMSAIKSPRVKENEVVAYSNNRSLSHDVVRYISTRRDWTKLYAVKLNLVLNPKTPMSSAMTFLTHLHAHDVRKVAHSRNIPNALATAAKRRLSRGR